MAKKSKIARNKFREKMVEKYREKRQELLNQIRDVNLSEEERMELLRKFNRIPRDASATRIRLRCEITGRPRGNYRRFHMSRNKFRELGLAGIIPGVTKSSW